MVHSSIGLASSAASAFQLTRDRLDFRAALGPGESGQGQISAFFAGSRPIVEVLAFRLTRGFAQRRRNYRDELAGRGIGELAGMAIFFIIRDVEKTQLKLRDCGY